MIAQTIEVDNYIASIDSNRQQAVHTLRRTIVDNLPAAFEELMSSMPSYVVPLALFPEGYHCTANTALPFMSFAAQKNFVALYHFGLYVDQELLKWFVAEYPKHVKTKLDMGKSCIRFRKPEQIPFELIAELCAKRSVDDWISCYSRARQV